MSVMNQIKRSDFMCIARYSYSKSSVRDVDVPCMGIYRARQKSNPLGKILYLWNCSRFFTKFTAFIEEDSGHIYRKFS